MPDYSAYAGRWVAEINDKIVGHGGTPTQALSAAKNIRRKEKPRVKFVSTNTQFELPPIVAEIQSIISPSQALYLVGGAVRDLLMKKPINDYDFTVPNNTYKVARKIANHFQGAFYRMDDEHETARVVLTDEEGKRIFLDFAVFRGENIDADLSARDFTLNAIALNVHAPEEIFDPTSGVTDIFQKTLRICDEQSFVDDPVRTLRAVRISVEFQFSIEADTKALLKSAIPFLPQVSVERIRDELFKILSGRNSSLSFRLLDILGFLEIILPELTALKTIDFSDNHFSNGWQHTIFLVQQLEKIFSSLDSNFPTREKGKEDLILGMLGKKIGRFRRQITDYYATPINIDRKHRSVVFLAALFQPLLLGNSEKTVKENLALIDERISQFNLSNAEQSLILQSLIGLKTYQQLLDQDEQPAPLTIYRLYREVGDNLINIILLSLAEHLAILGPKVSPQNLAHPLEVARACFSAMWETPEIVNPPSIIDGRQVQKSMKISAGPMIGEYLELVRERQVEGVVSDIEGAVEYLKGL